MCPERRTARLRKRDAFEVLDLGGREEAVQKNNARLVAYGLEAGRRERVCCVLPDPVNGPE